MSGTPDYILDAMAPWELFAHLYPEQARAREAEADYRAKCRAEAAQHEHEARWARIRAHDEVREAKAATDAGYPDPATFRAAQPAVVAVAEAIADFGLWADRRAREEMRERLLRSEVAEALGMELPGEAEPQGSIVYCRARLTRSEVESWLAGGRLTDLVRDFIASLGLHL